MRIPKGLDPVINTEINIIVQGNPNYYLLQVNRNLCGSKVTGRVWNEFLTKKLIREVGFFHSRIDECVLYKGRTLYLLYSYESILAGPDQNDINEIIKDIKKENPDIKVEGYLQDFLGINVKWNIDGTITYNKPHLIDYILKDIISDEENTATKQIPDISLGLLTRHTKSEEFDRVFDHISEIRKLNYLEKRELQWYIIHCASV